MIAVIFEAQTHPDQKDAYLNAAAVLRPLLAQIDGFVSIERFESLTQPGTARSRPRAAGRSSPTTGCGSLQ